MSSPVRPPPPVLPPEIDPALLVAFGQAIRAKIDRDLAAEAAQAEALRSEVVPKVAKAIGEARAMGLCRRVWLFGSFAWGAPVERSDVDLLIEGALEEDAARRSEGIEETALRVERACGRMVHAIELGRAPESLRQRVFASGRPL